MSYDQEPPEHLGPAGAGEWRRVVSEFDIELQRLGTLLVACDAYDMHEAAREQVAQEGLIYETGQGMKRVHPAAAVMRDAGIRYLRAMRELNIDAEPMVDACRPPRLGGR